MFDQIAAFLRCIEAARVIRTNLENSSSPALRNRLTNEAREAEFNEDIRETAERRRTERRAADPNRAPGLSAISSEAPSLGFSIDSDGHWHDRWDRRHEIDNWHDGALQYSSRCVFRVVTAGQ